MRTIVLIAIAAALMLTSAVEAVEPVFAQRLIFPLQEKHVHSSCIVELSNGDLLSCWFHGSGERRSSDVLIQGARLKKGDATWSDVFVMADTPNFPDLNPVLFVDPQHQLRLFFIAVMAERFEYSLLRCRTSGNYLADGAPKWSWQDDILLKPGDQFAKDLQRGYASPQLKYAALGRDFGGAVEDASSQLLAAARDQRQRQIGWMPRTHVIVLPSGRILLPLYSDAFYVGLMAISDDQGGTWRASSPIVGVGLNQPSVVRNRNGTLVAYMREEGDVTERVLISESKDDGETWSIAVPTDIPNPNTSLEVIALREGPWVMIYNDIEDGRDSLALAISKDEGASWQQTRHLERLDGGLFHYPSIIQTRDGMIHATYTHQPGASARKSIKHVQFNIAWVSQSD
jgi:predicted neuraminidase